MYTILKEQTGTEIGIGVSEVKKFDWYNQQYQNTKDQKPINYPAVYFEILDPQNWESGSNGLQVANMRVKLHIVVFDLNDEPNAVMTLTQKVYQYFNGKSLFIIDSNTQLTSKWSRVQTEFIKRYNQLKVMTITFNFSYFDSSDEPLLVNAAPVNFIINH